MNRKIYYWKLRTTELQLGERTLIMGILNATPDSFSDGGKYSDPDRAYARALEMEEQGADIIDLGAESTRPGSKRISADEEWQRLVPILKRLSGKLRIPLSLDTYKHETAERAMEYGVEIVNDPSGLTFDAELAKVAANANAGLILNHMRGTPETWAKLPPIPDVINIVGKEMEAMASRARRSGVEKNRLVLDPGLGFGKRKEQNAEILAHMGRLALLDYPILVGASRKSFLAQNSEHGALHATAAAVAAAILRGAHIVRVHDVTEMRAVAAVADEIARFGDGEPVEEEKKESKPRSRPQDQEQRYGDGEKAKPTRPPLAIRKLPPAAERPEPPREERPAYQKPEFEKPGFEKPRFDKPRFERQDSDRPRFEKPPFEKRPFEKRSSDKPPFEKREWKPRPAAGGDRPPRDFRKGPGDRPSGPPRPFRGSDDRGGPPKRPFRRDDDRGGPPSRPFRPADDRGGPPKRPFRPAGDGPPRGPRSSDRPPSGPPRSGPPRSGPPRGAAPKRPFRKRP